MVKPTNTSTHKRKRPLYACLSCTNREREGDAIYIPIRARSAPHLGSPPPLGPSILCSSSPPPPSGKPPLFYGPECNRNKISAIHSARGHIISNLHKPLRFRVATAWPTRKTSGPLPLLFLSGRDLAIPPARYLSRDGIVASSCRWLMDARGSSRVCRGIRGFRMTVRGSSRG